MNNTIWKYDVPPPFCELTHMMPAGAEFLDVQLRRSVGGGVMWFHVDADESVTMESRHFVSVPTGAPFELGLHAPKERHEGLKYLGTFQHDDGVMWHIFERLE